MDDREDLGDDDLLNSQGDATLRAPSEYRQAITGEDPFREDVAALMHDYLEGSNPGEGLLLLEVFRLAARYGVPAPYDALVELESILERYRTGECRTLDEAFDVRRPGNWKQPAQVAKSKTCNGMSNISVLWYRAKALQRGGMGTGDELWHALGDEFHVSPSRAKNWYYEIEDILRSGA